MSKEARPVEIPSGDMELTPPMPGTCPICAGNHSAEYPHNLGSMYYQMRFRQERGRFPTWEDAMQHCRPDIKAKVIAYLRERGKIAPEVDSDGG